MLSYCFNFNRLIIFLFICPIIYFYLLFYFTHHSGRDMERYKRNVSDLVIRVCNAKMLIIIINKSSVPEVV